MTMWGQKGWFARLAVLVFAATRLSGCGGETVASGSEAGTADAATPCPRDGGGYPQSPPSGSCSQDGLECNAVVFCETKPQQWYSCYCDRGTWSCTITGSVLSMCIRDGGPLDGGSLLAENTPDGLSLLTADQAASLKQPTVCPVWSLGPDGGAGCDIPIPTPPAGQVLNPNQASIVYDDGLGSSYLVLPNSSAVCDRGWQLADDTLIHICQVTCDLIQANPQATIILMFGCLSPPPPV